MLLSSETRQTKLSSPFLRAASMALLTVLAVGSASTPVMAQPNGRTTRVVNARQFRAEVSAEANKRFVPVNGARSWAALASPAI